MYQRDLRKPFELSEAELKALISKFEEIAEISFNKAFADNVNNFIGILREKYLIEEHAITNKEIKREITRVRNSLRKSLQNLDTDISDHTQTALFSALPGGMEEFAETYNAIEGFKDTCDIAIKKVNERIKPKEFNFPSVKQAMATELARELDSFDIPITAYRDGVFCKCVREFFNAFNGEAGGHTFRIYVPEDLFKIIQTAKDDHLTTERFILLRFR